MLVVNFCSYLTIRVSLQSQLHNLIITTGQIENCMNQYMRFVKHFLLLATPAIASSVLATSPSQAATFAFSSGNFNFTDFSQSPSATFSGTNANTLAIANGGAVAAFANANAKFVVAPPEASNSSLSLALGENRDYLGLAKSEATVIGKFDVAANTFFSFKFTGDLNLQTSIDNPPEENARASGDISFVLLDTASQKVLDFLSLAGSVITQGDSNFIATQNSDNVTLSHILEDHKFKKKQGFATASVEGSLQRSFNDNRSLALVEVKRNQARVQAPEPSTNLALLISSGLVGIVLRGKRKGNCVFVNSQ